MSEYQFYDKQHIFSITIVQILYRLVVHGLRTYVFDRGQIQHLHHLMKQTLVHYQVLLTPHTPVDQTVILGTRKHRFLLVSLEVKTKLLVFRIQ